MTIINDLIADGVFEAGIFVSGNMLMGTMTSESVAVYALARTVLMGGTQLLCTKKCLEMAGKITRGKGPDVEKLGSTLATHAATLIGKPTAYVLGVLGGVALSSIDLSTAITYEGARLLADQLVSWII